MKTLTIYPDTQVVIRSKRADVTSPVFFHWAADRIKGKRGVTVGINASFEDWEIATGEWSPATFLAAIKPLAEGFVITARPMPGEFRTIVVRWVGVPAQPGRRPISLDHAPDAFTIGADVESDVMNQHGFQNRARDRAAAPAGGGRPEKR